MGARTRSHFSIARSFLVGFGVGAGNGHNGSATSIGKGNQGALQRLTGKSFSDVEIGRRTIPFLGLLRGLRDLAAWFAPTCLRLRNIESRFGLFLGGAEKTTGGLEFPHGHHITRHTHAVNLCEYQIDIGCMLRKAQLSI
jgi:hypothetical protein